VRRLLFALIVLAAAIVVPTASSSQLIDRNAQDVKLAVNTKGEALLTYRAHGKTKSVLAWGAINAIPSTQARDQVKFKLDYAGGWGKYHSLGYHTSFRNACSAYDGPKLAWFVGGCKAPDGSYWALQAWQKMLPNYGLDPSPSSSVWMLHLSHWTGELPQLTIKLDWAYRQFDHLFGSFTYAGTPVYGFKATPGGNPLDTFGRNIYLDTFDSSYGAGWKRENSFLTHTGTGAFCYGFFSHGARPIGKGARYRATVIGPGVTPDAYWEGSALGGYDKQVDLVANDEIRSLGDGQCKAN
jgi:hypothetical protein